MGNQVQKLRQRELARKLEKREQLTQFLSEYKRRPSVFDQGLVTPGDFSEQRLLPNGADRLQALEAAHLLGDGFGDDGEGMHQLTDREREAWLYRMENDALDEINDNMELQEERRRERERREERNEELENLGADTGLGYFDHGDLGRDDPTMNRDDLYDRGDQAEDERFEERSEPSSRRSSPPASIADDKSEDDADDDDNDSGDSDDDDGDTDDDDDDDADDDAEQSDEADSEPEPEPEDAGGDY